MMMGRVRQFLLAAAARVSKEDREYVERSLPPALQRLFFAMSVPDQCHALRTARCAEKLTVGFPEPVDPAFLARCALLHDIGRKKGDLGTIGKSFAVLFAALCPERAHTCGDGGKGLMSKKMRVYFHHAEIGADMLENLGFSAEAAIIRRHHEVPAEDDPPELRLLRKADAQS